MPRNPSRDTRFSSSDRRGAVQDHADATRDEDKIPCRRGDWCTSDDTVTRWEDGIRVVYPAKGYRPFCDSDRAAIRDALDGFLFQYLQLHAELGQPAADRHPQHGKLTAPPLPIRGDVDALMRHLVDVLSSWNDRVADLPATLMDKVTEPDPAARWRNGASIVAKASGQLARRVTPLISLAAATMRRTPPGGDTPEDTELSGGDAGLEILHLEYRCRALLGEIDPKPDPLPGIACYQCHHRSLRRADPPQHADDIAYYSQCRRAGSCGHRMTEEQYRLHVTRLVASISGRVVTPVLELGIAQPGPVAGGL